MRNGKKYFQAVQNKCHNAPYGAMFHIPEVEAHVHSLSDKAYID
jgi:hypothetical protein